MHFQELNKKITNTLCVNRYFNCDSELTRSIKYLNEFLFFS